MAAAEMNISLNAWITSCMEQKLGDDSTIGSLSILEMRESARQGGVMRSVGTTTGTVRNVRGFAGGRRFWVESDPNSQPAISIGITVSSGGAYWGEGAFRTIVYAGEDPEPYKMESRS
jgi:hypothetical protein